MHDILAKIATSADLDRAVDEAVSEGLVSSDDRGEIKSELHDRLDSVASRHWFDGTHEFRNEIEIILPGGDFRRPDRVMVCGDKAIVVDYKFGQIKRPSYIRQVQQYMSYLTQMGYASVEGYVWYLEDNEIVEV
jgi:CRISPR/Cas system-associated exonuclease Cas4 (RecB family)